MKTYWGSGGIGPHILNFGTRWGRVVSFSPCYPLDRRLGGPQSRSGRSGEGKIVPVLFFVVKRKNPWPWRKPVVQPVAWSLYCLSYPAPPTPRCK
jgi:hypothetical protein